MGLRADEAGRVPFSLIAVLVLLFANAGALYIWSVNRSWMESEIERAEVRAMEDVASLTHGEVELEVRWLALDALRTAGVPLWNESRLNERLAGRISEFAATSFPRDVRGYRVVLEAAHAVILLAQRRTVDIVPASEPRPSTLNGTTLAVPDTLHLGVVSETSRIASYTLAGRANYSVSKASLALRTSRPIAGDVGSPLPVIESALGATAMAADGTGAEIGRMVRYMLTTAAQYRVLQGYAAGEYGVAGTTLADVLSATDVEVAVNLALLLEELRRFRALDPDAVAAVNATFLPRFAGRLADPDLVPSAAQRSVSALLEAYASGGYVDPADLFALFEALDAEPVRLNTILAQAIDAIVDQYTLRYLDYFGLAGLADLALEVGELLANAVQDFLDWVTGHDREADLVTGFVREFFGALNETTLLLAPAPSEIPRLDYDVAAVNGSTVRITIPAYTAVVPFARTDMTLHHDPTWKSYYGALFANDLKRVHASVRDFVADLARSIAADAELIGAVPNPALQGHVDPGDEESILEYVEVRVAGAVDDALRDLDANPGYFESLVGNVWRAQVNLSDGLIAFIEARFEDLANATEAIGAARSALASELYSMAGEDADWGSLDASGRAAVLAAIAGDVDVRGWVEGAYQDAKGSDLGRLAALRDRASSVTTPPENGGIYRRIVQTVTRTGGLLRASGGLIREFSQGLVGASDLRDTQVLLPVLRDEFAFWIGDREQARSRRAIERERLWVRQEPAVLRATNFGGSGAWDPAAVRVGDLWIDIMDPSREPGGPGSNTHYTDLRELSRRPWEAQWEVRILGAVRVTAGSDRAIFLGPHGHEPARGSLVVPIRMTLTLRVASGWPLAGVPYASSSTFAGDVWALVRGFVDTVWGALSVAFDWIFDAIAKVVETLVDLLRQLASYAAELLRALVESVRTTVELFQEWIGGALGALVPALETAVSMKASKTLTIHAAGITFDVFFGSPEPGTKLQVNATGEWFYAEARFVQLNETGASEDQLNRVKSPWDVLGHAEFSVANVTVSLDVDPLMVVQAHLVEGTAAPDAGGWELAFSVPYVELYDERSWTVSLPTVPTPLGTLDIEVGARLRLWGSLEIPEFADAIQRSFDEAFTAFYGSEIDLEAVGRFARRLAERFVHNTLQAVSDEVGEIREVFFYVEGVFKAGGAAGAGFRLALVAEGEAFVHLFRWLVDNVLTFFHNLLQPNAPADYPTFPEGVADHVFVRGEVLATVGMPRMLQRAAGASVPGDARLVFHIQGNVPAIGNLVGADWGRWRVDFGAYLERVPAAIAGPLFGTDPDVDLDVWLFHASLYER